MAHRASSWVPLVAVVAAALMPLRAADVDRSALGRIRKPPLGLPAVPVAADNRPTVAKIRLGRKLFFDRRLSHDGTMSCGMCHVPEQGFAVNEMRTAVGNRGTTLRRNAPTVLNVAYAAPFFVDGREPDLDLQPFDVFLNPDEMGAPSLGWLIDRVKSLEDYNGTFDGAPTVEQVGTAIGAYLRSLLSANSPFDRYLYGEEPDALSPTAITGYRLFVGKAGCAACHTVGEDHALFTDHAFHDTGIGWFNSTVRSKSREPITVELAPGVTTELPRSAVESVGEPYPNDLGRYEVTRDPADRWLFKTPSLRNVAVTAPYMHDGTYSTLHEVVVFYNDGNHPHDGLDSKLEPLGLDDGGIDAIVAFLESLTGDNLDELVSDARSQSVGNP